MWQFESASVFPAGLFVVVNPRNRRRMVVDKSTTAPVLSTAALVMRKKLETSGRYRGSLDIKGLKIAVAAPGRGAGTSLYWGLSLAKGRLTEGGQSTRLVWPRGRRSP